MPVTFTAVALAMAFAVPLPPATAPAQSEPIYRPPIDRPVESPFEVARGPYGAGNRGLDYAVRPGDTVAAIGAGTVVFAGSVAGKRWVTVLHPDGLRSSYGPLAGIAVSTGDVVAAGATLGATGVTFHLGVRRGTAYIDPATLFRVRKRHARLIPLPRAA